MHITLQSQMPLSQLQEFLQMVRDFEQKHQETVIIVAASAPTATLDEIATICASMKPPFPLKLILHR